MINIIYLYILRKHVFLISQKICMNSPLLIQTINAKNTYVDNLLALCGVAKSLACTINV